MNADAKHFRLLRTVGIATAVAAALPTFYCLSIEPDPLAALRAPRVAAWFLLLAFFGIGFWFITNPMAAESRSTVRTYLPLGVQTVSALGIIFLMPCPCIGMLLMLVAWQAALLFSRRVASAWVLVQSLLLGAAYLKSVGPEMVWLSLAFYGSLQAFILVVSFSLQSEAEGRRQLAALNRELRAMQDLLAQNGRLNERLRISRDLHDVVGHNLSALSLHLEIANRTAEGKPLEHVQKSQAIARSLLSDVREAVSALREDDQIDLHHSLQSLLEETPALQVHLSIPENLRVREVALARTVLRCVQEITTNALRHARATNLWLDIRRDERGIEVRARDDGRGALTVTEGNGLVGMRERLKRHGGELSIFTRPSDGFSLLARIPVESEGL